MTSLHRFFFPLTKIAFSVQPIVKDVNTGFRENSTNIFIADADSRKHRRMDVASPWSVTCSFRKNAYIYDTE